MLVLGRSSETTVCPLVKVAGASPELATLIVQFQDPPIDTEPPTSSVLVAVRLGQVTVKDAVAGVSPGCTLSTVACPVAPAQEVSVVSVELEVPPAPIVPVAGATLALVALHATGSPISSGIWLVVSP